MVPKFREAVLRAPFNQDGGNLVMINMAFRSMKWPAAATDTGAIEACRRGDRGTQEAVLRAHAPGLARQLARLVGPGADAEDLLQVTFLRAIRAFPEFRGEAPLGLWLARIAIHAAQDHLRRPDRRRRVDLSVVAESVEPVDPAPAPDRVTDARRQLRRLYVHLDAVSARNRVAFILHVLDGRPLQEVAAMVGASRVAAKSRVFLARRALLARVARDPALRDLLTAEPGRPTS